MGFFKRLERGIENTLSITPRSYRVGEKFEELVREIFFPKYYYTLVHKSPNYKQNKDDYVESSWLPDYKLRCTDTDKEFWVECKYRNITNLLDKVKDFFRKVRER